MTQLCFSHIGPGHRDSVCITLEPAQLLKGDIMVGKIQRRLFRVSDVRVVCTDHRSCVCSFVD